ncbi:exodeoxyribonuclease VII small subunit [Aerococcus sanguinicola]|uniref:Exodeoxyribonuclease 7 small subunit n=1 Tax=Aerococcus sanguinicola TaxID=119206 RepID=A0A0X8FCF5_9LACT|nr:MULTISPECIES: exodeoxyribonuclease VII small subunit [Aerococcus]AMB94693.1 exodeoxyribonuclease VII small subunit [Aerococcus sanguinicola]MDK6232760.1 exodeoxyribonuclease VII small subunit [Aerococcus sp. UMB10185]MDK6805291.1 exodeoxyribonuclease VII small subunit [Aerococcus sp. UMB7834]MDK6854950.1 exodeoxyribonuclease VII small subunit [Aerococcus sp. UMB7533]MDK7050904.1 exodeoxyribonuclease VII small subunit [Aerococcus sanguinicola]
MAIDLENLTFEQAMAKLEEIVAKLQNGDIPLADSMTYFQDGMALSKYCNDSLQEAEETMVKLMNENDELEDFDKQG